MTRTLAQQADQCSKREGLRWPGMSEGQGWVLGPRQQGPQLLEETLRETTVAIHDHVWPLNNVLQAGLLQAGQRSVWAGAAISRAHPEGGSTDSVSHSQQLEHRAVLQSAYQQSLTRVQQAATLIKPRGTVCLLRLHRLTSVSIVTYQPQP